MTIRKRRVRQKERRTVRNDKKGAGGAEREKGKTASQEKKEDNEAKRRNTRGIHREDPGGRGTAAGKRRIERRGRAT